MIRLVIVTALLGLLLLGEPPRQGVQLLIGLCAGAREISEYPPHPAGMHLGQVEMRLLVAQDAPTLRAVLQDDCLDPGIARPESGDHSNFEHITSAIPAGVQRVRGLTGLRAVHARGPLEAVPGEPPPR